MVKSRIVCALLAMLLSAAGAAFASETAEKEPNNPIGTAQRVDIFDGNLSIRAVLGNIAGAAVDDLDFYLFWGKEGDLVDLDIDGGIGGMRSVDTVIAIFGTGAGYPMLRLNDDAFSIDPGSWSTLDSRIVKFRLPATGHYIVGVSNFPRYFWSGGNVTSPTKIANGDYTLIISGVSSPVQQINIDVKPGSAEFAPVNPKSKGKIPVALLSSSEFDAMSTDTTSLTFGAKGDEQSLAHCGREGEDVNADGRLDMVCHFENQKAGFEPGDLEGIVRGKTTSGRMFEGHGLLKVVPEKRRQR